MRSTFTAEGLDWFASLPAAPAARLGDLLVVSGQVPLDDAMNLVAPGDLVAQTRHMPGEQFVADADDVANAALFLASDESRAMTGQGLVVDGGWTAL